MTGLSHERRLKLLYITGVSHCGSTFLGSLLGQLEGFFFAGELAHTARSLQRGFSCGCGEPLSACPVWRDVFARAFADTDRESAGILRLPLRHERARAILGQLLRDHRLLPRLPELERITDAFVATLEAVQAVTGCRFIVDSSKSPAYGRLLASDSRVDLYVVHIVRDPRATSWSWQRSPDLHYGSMATALIWDLWNPLIELLWARRPERYLRMRYEDFVAQPHESLQNVVALVGEQPDELPFISRDEVWLEPTHSVAGNPHRWRTGRVKIELDEAWLSAPGFRARRTVSTMTWPMRLRYQYAGILKPG